jgi:hypothetical protein
VHIRQPTLREAISFGRHPVLLVAETPDGPLYLKHTLGRRRDGSVTHYLATQTGGWLARLDAMPDSDKQEIMRQLLKKANKW